MMKAIVYRAHGEVSNLKLEEIPGPSIKPDEVLIRVRAVALNGFDPMMLQATRQLKVPLPMIPCGDFAGEIVEIGSDVDRSQWKPGDRVAPFPVIDGKGLIGETVRGACCELIAVPAKNLIRMPDGISFTDAASLAIAYGAALRMMTVRGQIKAGEKVLILGATGGVGVCCLQLAAAAGAEVIACGSSASKTAKLRELGATHVIDTSQEDFLKVIHRLYGKPSFYGGGGVDVIVNYIGGETWVPSLKCLTQRGRLLVCGATAGYDPKEDLRYIWSFEQTIIGSDGWLPEDQTTLMNMVVAGKLKPVIHSIRPLEEMPQAMQELIDREVFGKSVVTV
jgi:alcohol dehydrogenase